MKWFLKYGELCFAVALLALALIPLILLVKFVLQAVK